MKALVAGYDRFLQVLTAIVGVLIVIAMLLVTIDVVARYFFNRPMAWIFEATEYFMLFVPFLGMARLIGRDGHVRIDIIVTHLPPRAQAALDIFTSTVCTLACATVCYYAALSTISHLKRNVLTYAIHPIPKGYLIAAICLGFALATIEFARRSVQRWREFSGDPAAVLNTPPPATPSF